MNKTLSYYIREFLTTYLKCRKNYSINTIRSYRDTIKLFLTYCQEEKKINIRNINFDILTYENVNIFLSYIENKRNSTINTRNQRLACIKSLCKYIINYESQYLEQFQLILNIDSKKCIYKEMNFLEKDEIKEIMNKPDVSTKQGFKDLVALTLLYDGALRISELINLKTEDIIFKNPGILIIRNAKGKNSREIPISNKTINILKEYISCFNKVNNDYILESNLKEKYTSNGIRKIINKYTKNCRFKVSPHTFRHTKATHLLESGTPLIYIRDFLGHKNITTTEIYAKVNNRQKNEIIINNSISLGIELKYNIDNDTKLLEWLKTL